MKSGWIIIVARVERPIPFENSQEIIRKETKGTTVVIVILKDGSPCVTLTNDNGERRETIFQRVATTAPNALYVEMTWDESSITLNINFVPISPNRDLPPIQLPPSRKNEAARTRVPILPHPKAASEAEKVFLVKLSELHAARISPKQENLLRASAALRLLLLDGLLHEVNRNIRAKVAFEIHTTGDLPVKFEHRYNQPDPDIFPGCVVESLTLDKFLANPVIHSATEKGTIRDLIAVWANSKGGVHFGPPKEGSESMIQAFDTDTMVLTSPASFALLAGICNITLKALLPLAERICFRAEGET